MPGLLVAVNVAHVIETPPLRDSSLRDTKPVLTGIDKRPASGPVDIGPLGLVGDSILDTEHHGGTEQAVYAYALEDLQWWTAELGAELDRPVAAGNFGENLTVSGIDVTAARVGDRWRVGAVTLEVTSPRIPCSTFAAFMGVPHWVKRFALAERPGAYLRVVVPGPVAAGDPVEVVSTSDGRPIQEIFAAHYGR